MQIIVFVCLLLSLLSGCVSQSNIDENSVRVSQQGHLRLTTPAAELFGKTFMSHLQVEYGESTHELIMQLELNAQESALVAISPAGLPLFQQSLSADGKVSGQSFVPINDLKPQYIFADIQLVHWPLESLQKALTGLSVVELNQGQGKLRRFSNNQQSVIEIHYLGEQIIFKHLQRHYQITITAMTE